MIDLDDELVQDYLRECGEHLATMETDLIAIEKGGAEIDEEVVNRALRAVQWVKVGAGSLDLYDVRELALRTEDVLALICSHRIVPTPERVGVLLGATDRMQILIHHPGTNTPAETAGIIAALSGMSAGRGTSVETCFASAVYPARQDGRRLRTLLVEDDFASRLLLQTFLSRYGECHVAVNGVEAVDAVGSALDRGEKYDLICMDIMMPEMDGSEAVRQVRALEEAYGFSSTHGARIIMTTAVTGIKVVIQCFRVLCDAYLMKPIDLAELLRHMKGFQLVP